MSKNILSAVSLVPLLLYLILISENASACTRRGRPFYHRHHHHENGPSAGLRNGRSAMDNNLIPNEYHVQYPTSCGERLCSQIELYPREKINHSINKIRVIMASSDPEIAKMRDRIRPGVLEFQKNRLEKGTIDEFTYEKNECKVSVSALYPREVFIEEDNKVYYIVNIPSFTQGVINIECIAGKLCQKGYSECTQNFREEEFLVLPKKNNDIQLDDFRVRKIPIFNGCDCSRLSYYDLGKSY